MLLVVAFVAGVSLAFCVVETMRGAALPAAADDLLCAEAEAGSLAVYLRCDGLTKASASGGISSQYVITNLGETGATTQHTFYAVGDDWQSVPGCCSHGASIGAGQSETFDLADVSMSDGHYYVIVAADQLITGTILAPSIRYSIFLPLVIKQPPLPPPSPLMLGDMVRFEGVWNYVPLEGRVVFSEYRDVLVDDYQGHVYPYGIFVVTVMDITNFGLESDEVGLYSSFRVMDSVGRQFDLADVQVQLAAEDEYGYDIVYEAIQPGFTRRLVFVFDVLPASEDLHLVSLSPW